jgi:hypothetical protein
VASALMVLGGLAATTLLGYRRRRDDVSAAGALALVLCLAIVQFTLSVPVASFAAVGYGLWWASPVGMFAWLVLGWSLATLFVPVARLRSWAPLARHAGRLPALGAAAAIATGALVGMGAAWREEPYEEMRSIADRLEATLPERATRVDVSAEEASFFGLDLQTGTVNALRRQGRDDVTAPNIEESLGPDYGGDGAEPEQVVGVYVDSAPPARARVLFRRRLVDSPEPGDPFAAEARARLVSLALAAARERR